MRNLAAIGGITPRALPVVAVLLAASAGIISSTSFADRAIRTLAAQSLESTARGISLAAEQVLTTEDGRSVRFERLFSERLVAYALIASADGTVLFHTNPDLRGTPFDDRETFDRLAPGTTASRRALLGTGRPVLLYDRLLPRRQGQPALLRLALHTVETDRMTARVARLWWSVGAVLLLLWAGGLLVVVLAARTEKHRREAERGESLALIGQMTSTLAHEIRNAIGSVKGYAQLAAERTETGDPRAQQLATVLRGVARIEQLVGDLLLFSREERFTVADVDPAPLLSTVVAAVEPWQGRVELDLEPGLRVRADAEKLERAITNGVHNAVQAMGGSGLLSVVLRRQGDRIAIRIEDTGSGIAPEALPKLFTPFYTTRTTGTGLGLAYAKKVVEGMGGTLELKNREGASGAVFTVLLPAPEVEMGRAILVVEDDELMRSFLVDVLVAEGHRVESASDGSAGLARLERDAWDLVITDLKMPGLDGLALLREGRKLRPEARWIVITAHGSIESAVEAMKAGATDYLLKPFKSPDELRLVVRRALREAQSEARIALLSEELGRDFPPGELIFLGAAMEQLQAMVREVAPTTAGVLLSGASGTGKEVLARVIHAWSPRRDQPFVAVNCAALAESLLESELFGHERGAFTGAVAARKGRFELADGGTLFLDEVGEIAPAVQVKLLRVLQERVVERVGGVRPVPVDVRVIAATNRDLKALVAAGDFREDLFYRLNVFPLRLPALAERTDAVIPLADFFRSKFTARFGKQVDRFTAAAQEGLRNYAWPGNIRELQNVVERAVILARGEIDIDQLSLEPAIACRPGKGGLKAVEHEEIERVLRETAGNRRKAAAELGISLRTLQYRLKEYGIS